MWKSCGIGKEEVTRSSNLHDVTDPKKQNLSTLSVSRTFVLLINKIIYRTTWNGIPKFLRNYSTQIIFLWIFLDLMKALGEVNWEDLMECYPTHWWLWRESRIFYKWPILTTQTHTIHRGSFRFATQISPLLDWYYFFVRK